MENLTGSTTPPPSAPIAIAIPRKRDGTRQFSGHYHYQTPPLFVPGRPPPANPLLNRLDTESFLALTPTHFPFTSNDRIRRLTNDDRIPYHSPAMDPFAQSRADDDLFADDIEPVAESVAISEEPVQQPSYYSNSSQDVRLETRPEGAHSNGGFTPKQPDRRQEHRQDHRQRGGRGRGGQSSNQHGMSGSRFADHPEPAPAAAPTQTSRPAPPPDAPANADSAIVDNPQSVTANAPQEGPGRIPAVRGDRSATGGPAHKKLTEEELTAKLQKMAILNAKKSESHRASEADQAAFQKREQEQAKERREKAVAETNNSRAMEMARASNRERKMNSKGGREWDSEKVESDIVDKRERTSNFVRGGFGGVKGGLGNSRYATKDDENNSQASRGGLEIRGRGRGGGGSRGGNGGGRGKAQQRQATSNQEEFPPLSSAAVSSPKPAGDWAEEMATPSEEKKVELGEKEVV